LVGCFAFQAGSLDKRRSEGGANMDKRKLWNLISAPGLAVTSLLFVFLLLGWHTAGATLDGDSTFSEIRAPSATFTVSGTVTCEATGPIADVEVSAWDQLRSSVVASDSTDSSGVYSVTLDEGIYYLELVPPATTGLNARAFTTTGIVTDTALDVNFCVCSGIWVSETVDSAGTVGGNTSLALAPTHPYTPNISYHDGTSNTLKYARLNGTAWISETVDLGGGWTSLALVLTYPHAPCISHVNGEQEDLLRYACLDGSTWISMTVARHLGGSSLGLEPTYPYTPHISYSIGWYTHILRHAYLRGTTWCSGTWENENVELPGSGMGGRTALALESIAPYTPHISYHDARNTVVKHAWLSGTIWLSETVDTGNVGVYTSLALDSGHNPQIIYYHISGTNYVLRYAWKSGNRWFTRTVDSTGKQEAWSGRVAISLELDQTDMPRMSYYDAVNGDLKLARFDGKVWIIQTVDSTGDVGQYSSLALDQMGCPHISYYDAINGDLKYAYVPRRYWVHLPFVLKDLGP
jgi:hypothetical protein